MKESATVSSRSDVPGTRQLGRSIGALLVGFVAVVVLSLGIDEVLHLVHVYPPWGQIMSDPLFGLATAYRLVISVFGSYLTARLAPYKPMQHALIGGVLGMILGTLGAVATWNHEPPLGPHWYSLALVVTALPTAWLGGQIRVGQLRKSSS